MQSYIMDVVWALPFFFQFPCPLPFLFSSIVQHFISYLKILMIGRYMLIVIVLLFILPFVYILFNLFPNVGQIIHKVIQMSHYSIGIFIFISIYRQSGFSSI